MFHSSIAPQAFLGSAVLPGDPPSMAPKPRGLHARLLETAAARRRRALERRSSQRHDDAAYWLQTAPMAVAKATAVRTQDGFSPLP